MSDNCDQLYQLVNLKVLFLLLFFVVGDYRDRTIVVWSTYNYGILVTTKTNVPMHNLRWDPFTVNEFVSVGANGTVLFWLLDETGGKFALNVHEATVPDELLQLHHVVSSNIMKISC